MKLEHILMVIIIIALIIIWVNIFKVKSKDFDCKDFSTQAQAQQTFNQYPEDVFNLDRDKDGIACEGLPQ